MAGVFRSRALSLGIGHGAYDCALKYSKERKQFGKAISDFQAIQWKLADMATELDAAWLLTMRAASMKDAASRLRRNLLWRSSTPVRFAVRCANESVQIHGGYGFVKDYRRRSFIAM